MTPEKLEKLVALGDSATLAEAVADLTEADRRALSKKAQAIKRDLDNAQWETINGTYTRKPLERLLGLLGKKKVEPWQQSRAAHLAILAVGPLSQVRKISAQTGRQDEENLVLKIMMDRRPDWSDDWLASALEGEYPSLDWETLWGLVQAGVCQKPTSEAYYRAMAHLLNGWHRWHQGNPVPLSDVLASEPELLEDLWKLFEVDTVAFSYDWGDGRDPAYETWPTAFLKLAERGIIDRERLLDATLDGQTTGFKKNVIGGFAKLHERLEPTPDEMAARQSTYCDLMSVHVSQVVGFAVKMIKKVEQAKRLDDGAFVSAARPVFDVSTKGPPKAVISLLKKISKRKRDLAPQVCRALVDGLGHGSEDVQSAAIDLLAELADTHDEQTIAEIADRLDDLPATVRPRASELVVKAGRQVESTDSLAETGERLAECKNCIKEIEAKWLRAAGAQAALDAIESSIWPPPLDFKLMQVPILSGLEPVEPIESLDELIDSVAHGIEQVDSAIEVERILDGISRLCDQKPDDFERRVAPLIKRIEKSKDSDATRGIAKRHIGPRELSKVVGTWLADQPELGKPSWDREGGSLNVTTFIDARLAALRQRIAERRPGPLLAAPTHQHGWIAPEVVVSRWRETEQLNSHPAQPEIIQALLRLAPDGRETALAAAGSLTHRWARPLRWALGSDEGPTAEDVDDADLWLAAGRARSPHGFLEELVPLGLDTGPDAARPATYDWRTKVREQKYNHDNSVYRYPELDLETKPKFADNGFEGKQGQPTLLRHMRLRHGQSFLAGAPWVHEWISMVWPANVDAFFAAGCQCLMSRLDETSSSWEPNHAFLSPLFDVDRPWSKVANLLAVLGVAGRDQDVRGLAIDALVEAIADGRVHPAPLGETLATLALPYWLKLNRLCANLAEVARVSPQHAWTVMAALHMLLIEYEELPRDAHFLVALLQELQAQLGVPTPETVADKLRSVKGASKTAKLSRALVSFSPQELTAAGSEASLLTLEARLDRAQRWAGGN